MTIALMLVLSLGFLLFLIGLFRNELFLHGSEGVVLAQLCAFEDGFVLEIDEPQLFGAGFFSRPDKEGYLFFCEGLFEPFQAEARTRQRIADKGGEAFTMGVAERLVLGESFLQVFERWF